jgi:ABC-type nitrate/sulfonate/bicarbonate transport system permease component
MSAWRSNLAPIALGLGTLLAIAALLEVLIGIDAIDRYLMPPPSEVFSAFGRLFSDENIVSRFLVTAGETLAAGLLLAIFGVGCGALLFRFVQLRRAYETWIAAFAAAPIVLSYPLFLVMTGRGSATVVLVASLAALPAVILKTLEGFSQTPSVYVLVGKSLNASRRKIFSKILFPAALPSIFVGLRLGLLFAMLNIVGVEFLINTGGLGQLVNELSERYDLAATYAAILCVVLVSVLFFMATEWLERRMRRVA